MILRWIDLPAIVVTYFCVIIYLIVFRFSGVLVVYLLLSLLSFVWQNGWPSFLKLCLVLVGFACICGGIKFQEARKFDREQAVTEIKPMLDTIQVNGDQLAFRGKSSGQSYQVYYKLTSKKEQQYFKYLAKNVTLTVSASLERASQQRNFEGFDYQAYLKTQKIYRILTIDKIHQISEERGWYLPLLRRRAILFCERQFPKPMSAYMTGLLFGYLGQDFDELGEIYRQLGIMHLFALSGMQVAFFVDVLRQFLFRLGVRRDLVALLQVPFSVGYAGMTGFSISVMRALIQKLLSTFGVKGLDNFSLTLLLLFIWQPQFLLTVGGSLSMFFAFVLAMFGKRFDRLGTYQRLLAESLVLSLAVLPLLMLYFHSFQPLSILLTTVFSFLFDVLFLPALSLIFLLAIGTGVLLTQANAVFIWLERLIQWVDELAHYPLVLGKPQPIVFLLLLLLIGCLIDFWPCQKVRGLLILGLVSLFWLTKNPLTPTITIVDVGQGDSIFLQDRLNQRNLLIDTGGRVSFGTRQNWQIGQTAANADKTLIPYLKSRGVGQIDTLVVTHADEDHVGDLLALNQQIKINKIVVSEGSLSQTDFVKVLKRTQAKIQIAQVGQQLQLFDSYLEVLFPFDKGDGGNNDSIVLYGKFYQTKFLFTGDLEADGEAALLARYPTLTADVLKVGHHGSKTSSSESFIKAIRPKVALISCGQNNRYQHPNPEIVTRLQQYGVKLYRTDQQGAIKFEKMTKSWQILTVK
ncbi:MAG: DNA internalization-related competence protein ComEC/Rec2 [Streptococcaceae bacterium]|jgi:competence protein ComEC|nr:DNA internalization-related competence protein ComEC/Rec2 [Streptococcaceae bacterium]